MTFKEVLAQVVDWLQQDGCVSHRALQRQFDIDDAYLKDLKEALLYTHAERLYDDGQGFVWSREPTGPLPNAHHETDSESVNHGRGEFVRDEDGDGFCEVHVTTMEGCWSLLRSWLRPHQGIS